MSLWVRQCTLLFLCLQRVKELEEEASQASGKPAGSVDPIKVAERFLEHPRMEQRFFGFRFKDLMAKGLSMNLLTLTKVFTTLSTIQGLADRTK